MGITDDIVSVLTIKVSALTFYFPAWRPRCRGRHVRRLENSVSDGEGQISVTMPVSWKGGIVEENPNKPHYVSFILRAIHNLTKDVIRKSIPISDRAPQTQLQGGILGYLFHHRDGPVYQKDIEKEFRISRATATNTLQVMEKNGLIVRRSQDKDARLKRIFLTEEAEAGHAKVEEHMRRMDARMLNGLSDADVAELNRCLRVIMDNLAQMRAECLAADDVEEGDAR